MYADTKRSIHNNSTNEGFNVSTLLKLCYNSVFSFSREHDGENAAIFEIKFNKYNTVIFLLVH